MDKTLLMSAVLNKHRDDAVAVRTLSLSERFNVEIDGVVERVDDGYCLGVIPVLIVKSTEDEGASQQLAVLQLSVKDSDALSRVLNNELSDLSGRNVKSFKLKCTSNLLNTMLFQGEAQYDVSLNVLIEFDDGSYLSPGIDAYVFRDASSTKQVLRKVGNEFPAVIILTGITCFQMWGLSTVGGIFLTTVCFGTCLPLFTCECKFKGGGVCTGWTLCGCGIKIFGVHVSLIILFVLIALIGMALYIG